MQQIKSSHIIDLLPLLFLKDIDPDIGAQGSRQLMTVQTCSDILEATGIST
jgi:hypothetical protein